jgi:hypothetical protein
MGGDARAFVAAGEGWRGHVASDGYIYTHVSILKLLEVYAAAHPAARISQARAKVNCRDNALAWAEAADLLTALDDEEDAVANGTAAT